MILRNMRVFPSLISYSTNPSLSISTRRKEGSLLYPNLLNNGLCTCAVQHRWKSNKFTLHGNLSMNNIKLFPDSPLKKIVIQSNSQDIISNERTGMCGTKYEPSIARAVVCYIPASFHLIFMIKMIHLLHQQMLWIYYRLVAFHICKRLPLKHDNKSCVKEIAYTQLKTETNCIQFWYNKDLKQFFKKKYINSTRSKKENECLVPHVFFDFAYVGL